MSQVYDWMQWYECENRLAPILTSTDGITYNLAANLTIASGVSLTGTGTIYATGNLTLSGTPSTTSTVTVSAANGKTSVFTLTGLSSHYVYLADNTGAVKSYVGPVSSFSYYVPNTATGTWTWVAKKAGYKGAFGTFVSTTGGAIGAVSFTPQDLQPDGSAMLSGTTDSNIVISFSGTSHAYIDIKDAVVSAQNIYNMAEAGLITQPGMAWLAGSKSDTTISTLFTGYFLFLTSGWRLRAFTTGQANTSVAAFAISTDGTPVDGTNGPVAYLSSSQLTSQQVRDAMTLAASAGTPATGSIDNLLSSRLSTSLFVALSG